jgi:SnoaL-like domain
MVIRTSRTAAVARMIVLAAAMSVTLTSLASPASASAVKAVAGAGAPAPILIAQASDSTANPPAASLSAKESAARDACAAPREYVKLINAGRYDAIGGLFADDAVYLGPDGRTRHGSKDIGEFYKKLMGALRPQVKAASYMPHGNDCLMELENKDQKSGRYDLIAIDHFIIDPQGKVSKFIVYLRPGSRAGRQLSAALAKVH